MKIRIAGVLGLMVLAQVASAQFVYNVHVSNVSFLPSGNSEPVPWTTQGPNNQIIDFLPGAVPVVVGDSTGNAAAIVTLIYEVDATNVAPVQGIGMTITGLVMDKGRILWSEVVEDLDNNANVVLAATGSFEGSAYPGGSDGSIAFNQTFNFSQSVTRFKVKKTFFLDIGDAGLPTNSIAALGIVEQTMIPVPEPATMGILGVGVLALAARRRNRR